jgi:glycosyltransferase involved in cell wall biosynthesis
MKVLILSQYYPPETGACAHRISGFARYLAAHGHAVTVITGLPHYPHRALYPGYRVAWCQPDADGDVHLLRCWLARLAPRSPLHRLLNYLGFFLSALWAGCFRCGPQDVIVATSGPIFVGFAGALLAWLKRTPFVLDVRDLWPERIVAAGEFRHRLAIWLLARIETFMYWRASRIVCVTAGLYERLRQRGRPAPQLSIITNGTDPEVFRLAEQSAEAFTRFGIPRQSFIVVYAGTLGLLQDHALLLHTATALQAYADIYLVLIGEGVKKAEVQAEAVKRRLTRLIFLPNLSREQLATVLPAAHIGINANTHVAHNRMAIPVKMFDYMACGLPVVLANDGDVPAIVAEAQAGLCTPPGDADLFVQAILTLYHDAAKRSEMGARGRAFVLERYATQVLAGHFEALLLQTGSEGQCHAQKAQSVF